MTESLPPPPHADLPPLSRSELRALFDYLDRPNPPPCTHALAETVEFLTKRHLPVQPTVAWLERNGGHCDCEVILNTDAEWGEWAGRILDEDEE